MKKINVKKVIVSGALGIVLLGIGAGAAASDFWIGRPDVQDVQQDLIELDGMLFANEIEIDGLTTKVDNLEGTIDELIASLGLESGDYADLQAKLDKIQEEANTNKKFSEDTKIILGKIETAAGITSVPNANDVNTRVAAIYTKALAYHTDLTTQIANLNTSNAKLVTEKATLTKDLSDANADLSQAAADVKSLKTQSNNIVNAHKK